jgi:multiple sugar transport system substrate-binding protein
LLRTGVALKKETLVSRLRLVVPLLIASLVAVVAATTGGATSTFTPVPASQHVDLTMVSYMPLVNKTELNTLISGFEAAHPNIKVTVQTTATANTAGINTLVQQDEAAGQTPDVVQAGLDSIPYYAHGGFGAHDLATIAGADGVAAEWGGKYPYEPAVRQLGRVQGKQYAIPWTLSTPVLFYNADLFKKAGLTKPPANWTQVQQDAVAIKKATGADGISSCAAGVASSGVDWCIQAIIRSNGGTVMSADEQHLTWTTPAAIGAVKMIHDLGSSGAMVNVAGAQFIQEFAQGKLAMILNSSALQASLQGVAAGHFQLAAAPLPGFGSKQSVPTNSGSALTILSKDSLKQRASWELIQYLTSPSAYTQITKNVGYAPLRTTLVNDKNGLYGWKAAQTLVQTNLDQLKRLVPWQGYPGPNFSQIETLLVNAVESAAFEGGDPATVLTQAQKQATSLLP